MTSIEMRLQALEKSVPRGYETFNADSQPVIQSDLPALEWIAWTSALLRSRACEAEKAKLRAQLAASRGADGDGGYLYQVVAVMAYGPVAGPDSALGPTEARAGREA
jgi:hypothetical protein